MSSRFTNLRQRLKDQKMKVLPYNANNKDVINTLYHALMTGRPFRTPEARVVNKIKRAFEAQADVVREKDDETGRIRMRFKILCKEGEEKQIRLENAEFDLLKGVFMGIEGWSGPSTEDVELAEDYLNKTVIDLEDWEKQKAKKEVEDAQPVRAEGPQLVEG